MYLLLTPVDSSRNDNRYRLAKGWPTFSSLAEARDFVETTRLPFNTPDISIHQWLGEVRDGEPIFAGDPLPSSALFLALPHHGAGCRDEHRPLLKLAEEAIGQGLPLDALIGNDSGDPDDWEIDDSDRGEVLSLYVKAAGADDVWEVGDDPDYPPAAVEAAVEWASSGGSPASIDFDGGEYYGEVHVAMFDGEIIGCYDDPFDAAEVINDRLAESRHGYPWAWNWAYYLGERSADNPVVRAIKAAGYTVATQTATGYLFAGIDGGGYDFDSARKAPLGAALSHLWYQLIDGAIPVGPALS